MNKHEQPGEKQEGGPLNVVQRFLELVPVGCEKHDDGTDQCDPRHGDVRNWMQEEIENDQDQNEAGNFEHFRIFDAVLGFKFGHVSDSGTRELIGVVPFEEHETRDDAHQNSRTHFNDEVVEGHAVVRHVGVLTVLGRCDLCR